MKNNWGALKLWYYFLRSFYKYLLVSPFLRLPCPQTLVSVAFSSPNDTLGVQTMPQNFSHLFQLCIEHFYILEMPHMYVLWHLQKWLKLPLKQCILLA